MAEQNFGPNLFVIWGWGRWGRDGKPFRIFCSCVRGNLFTTYTIFSEILVSWKILRTYKMDDS